MKIILINPDYMLYANPPLGLAYLAGYVRKILPHIDIEIYDQIPFSKMLKKIKKDKPDVIGLSAVALNFYKVKKMANEIKGVSKALLVIGGRHITTMPESFKNTAFDVAILGEGEIGFIDFIRSYEKNKLNIQELKKIPGLLLKDDKKIINTGLPRFVGNLDDIPMPSRGILNMRYYSTPSFSVGFIKVGSIITSRGCPYDCRFCSARSFWGRGVRFFSAERVANEIELLYRKYGFKRIEIYDDTFTLNIPRLKKVISILKKKNLLGEIEFVCMGTAKGFSEETAKLLKRLNVIDLTFGFESGSDKVLRYLKKYFSVQDSINTAKICKKYQIHYSGYFMLGSPYETEEDIMKTYEFIKKYCPNFIAYQTVPLPGTEIWDYALKQGIIKQDMYENEQKEFIDIDTSYLLTKEIPEKRFVELFNKVNSLKVKQNQRKILESFLKRPFLILKELFNPYFLKKAYSLRRQFIRRISGR